MNSAQTIQYTNNFEQTQMSDMIGTLYAVADELAQCTAYARLVNINMAEVYISVPLM